MLYQTDNQILIFLLFFLLGFLTFFIFFFETTLIKKIKQKKLKTYLFAFVDILLSIIISFIFILLNTIFNFGQTRLFIYIAFALGLSFYPLIKLRFKNTKTYANS